MTEQIEALDPLEADLLLGSTIMTDEGRQDPYPAYARLRAGGGRWTSAFGAVGLAGYEDCTAVLRNPALGRPEADMDMSETISGRQRRVDQDTSTMLMLNPPDHTRIRGLVSRAFTPKRVEALRPEIDALLQPVVDRIAEQGGGDIIAELAIPFPVAVISELLGVPREGNEHIQPLVRAITAFVDPASTPEAIAEAESAGMVLAGYFTELIDEKRATPDDRLLSALIEVEEAGDRLTTDELLANTLLLYAAGFETTSNLIGNGLRLLIKHPDEWRKLSDDRSLLSSAVVEILRADSPVQLNNRVALEEVELLGETWQRGSSFIVLQGSGNHDERIYQRPELFDVTRFTGDAPPPLSFGYGAHHCLGAHLARAEGELAFAALLDRFEEFHIDDPDGLGLPRYRPSFTLRGLESLPVVATMAK
ncbi:MAG: cytochrome P450 [Actinobacteria bacterium]|nr:cytochrome P450 [Actinomycetota bacterium]